MHKLIDPLIRSMELIPANSLTFELAYIAASHCECGGTYQAQSQQLLFANDLPIDRVQAQCERCGQSRDFYFDIHSFYGQGDQYQRFEATEAVLRVAVEAIHAQQWTTAEAHLRQVIDPEQGEPAFGWGHYHLGMVLLVQGRHEEGLAQIQAALRWHPGEAEFYRGLNRALTLLGRTSEAEEARVTYQELQQKSSYIPRPSE